MAAANPLQNLLEEATCPICLGPFKDPVITPCVHHFCRSCITGCSQKPGDPLCCPQCREPCSLADLKPNRQLQSIVELVRQLSVQLEKFSLRGEVCVQHEEKLKLFCQDDKKLICVICQVSSEHERHRVRPIIEAAREYQGKLQNWLPPLQKERDAIVASKQKEEEEYKNMRGNLQAERMKTAAEFERLRQLLKEKEQTILERLEEMDRKITLVENANIAKLSNQISSLETLLKEIETKCKQSPEELLKDVGLTLGRCENVKFRGPQLKIEKNKKPSFQNKPIVQTVNTSQKIQNIWKPEDVKRYKVLVTLDPQTAHRSLNISEDGRCVRNSGKPSFMLHYPNSFTVSPCVLGKEGFSSGKYYWEVQLLLGGLEWTLGVARESVNKHIDTDNHPSASTFNGPANCRLCLGHSESPNEGIWAVHVAEGQYFALTFPRTALRPRRPPKKVGVYLNYEERQVSLYSGDTMEVLYTFSGASFNGKVHPYFNLCGKNKTSCGIMADTILQLV